MPGSMVTDELPATLRAPWEVPLTLGAARPASGSPTEDTPVVAPGLSLALRVALTPPTTWMLVAVMAPLALAEIADDELDSTSMIPGTLMLALPDMVKAPLAVGLRIYSEAAGASAVVVLLP